MTNMATMKEALRRLTRGEITKEQYEQVLRGAELPPVVSVARETVSVVSSGNETVREVQKEPAEEKRELLLGVPRGTSASLAQETPVDGGAETEGRGEVIRERLPPTGKVKEGAVQGLRRESANASPQLQQTAVGGLAVQKASPPGAWSPERLTWNQEQKEYAVWLTNQDNIAHRGEFDGDKEKQVAGMLGQVIVADAFAKQHGLTRPVPGKGHDGGKDFIVAGKRVDLKTLIRSVPPNAAYQHNIPAPQVNNPVLQTDVYLFGELDKTNKTYHLVGWLTAKEFKERAELRSRGEQKVRMDGSKLTFGVDTYEVDCNKLHYWAGFDRFEDELAQL